MGDSIKKRKWDQADHGESLKSSKFKVDVDPSKAASEAAARINAMLAQKGIPLHETIEKKDGAYVKDIPINDLKNRYMLIKGATHTQIHEETGADVITRGKYYPDKSLATDREPPLYLHVTASTKEALEKALDKIDELIKTAQVPSALSDKSDFKRTERKFFEKILPVNVNGTPHFNLRAKIVGPGGAYVKHINQETGCRIQLKGKGSGFLETSTGKESEEPLHVHLSCNREEGLQAGIKLTQDLLDTVKQEAERGPQHHNYNRGGYSNGGYSNSYNYDYNQTNTPTPPPPASASSTSASNTTPTTGEYDYDAYRDYYNSYYSQQDPNAAYSQDPNAYQQYDANAYYNYYGYGTTGGTDSTTAPPPPPPSSSSSAPPPPPGASSPPPASSLPPPPPPSA